MDSPKVNIIGLRKTPKPTASHLMSENIPMNIDDSGYITVTPSSAELTAISGGNSRRAPLSLLNSPSDSRHNISVTPSLFTPRGKRLKTGKNQGRPKQLRECFLEKTTSLNSHVNVVPLCNNSYDHSISVGHKVNSSIVIGAFHGNNENSSSQHGADAKEGMEWSDGHQTESTKVTSESQNDICLANVLPDIIVSDFGVSVFEFKGDTANTQSASCVNVNGNKDTFPSCSSIIKVNPTSEDITESSSSRGTVSPITRPSSYSNAPHKHNHKEKFRSNIQLTPEKNENLPSPTIKCDYLVPKSAKKLNFNSQKIGTPEKNSILYSNLKTVNFPKKIKSPEKLRATSVSSTKCRKQLFCNKENDSKEKVDYSRQKYMDFLKMLGEQQYHVPAVKSILSYLSCKDLMKVCCVSKTWNRVCCNDKQAATRKRIYARQIEMHKENIDAHLQMSPKKSKMENDPMHSSAKGHRILAEIDNNNRNRMPEKPSVQRSPPVSPGKRKFNAHLNLAMKHSIKQCVRCRKMATVKSHRATCSGLDCGFQFCIRCLTEYSDTSSHVCCRRSIQSVSPSKDYHSKLYIGTKKSRRNLQRL